MYSIKNAPLLAPLNSSMEEKVSVKIQVVPKLSAVSKVGNDIKGETERHFMVS